MYAAQSQDGSQGERVNAQYKELLVTLKEEADDRDYIVISSKITRELHGYLSDLLRHRQLHKKATVFLTTFGGDPDGGYRIARCLRHHYTEGLRVVVASWCKSAGTLIVIAADEIAMGDRGELGPLDVQVYKGSELQERSSGLDITEALGLVGNHVRWGYKGMLTEARKMGLSTKLAAEMAAHVGAAIAGPLLAQIDPLRLGELQRATRIAADYGNRLDAYSQNLKDGALKSLIHDYPSHSFVIDRKEAAKLFERVDPLTPAEQKFVDYAWLLLEEQTNGHPELIDFSDLIPKGDAHEPPDQPPPADQGDIPDPADPAPEVPGELAARPRNRKAGRQGVRVRGGALRTNEIDGQDGDRQFAPPLNTLRDLAK